MKNVVYCLLDVITHKINNMISYVELKRNIKDTPIANPDSIQDALRKLFIQFSKKVPERQISSCHSISDALNLLEKWNLLRKNR